MEPEVDATIQIQASVVKDSSQKPKLLGDPISLLIIPETPIRKREKNSKLDLNFISSQVAQQDDDNLRTPKETVFDPFVNVVSSEPLEDPSGKISRRLDFPSLRIGKCDAADPEAEVEEESWPVLDNLLDAIVSEQAEELLLLPPVVAAAADDDELLLADGCKTPPMSPTSVCGIAFTCPPAPRKSAVEKTLRIIDISFCKKLQF